MNQTNALTRFTTGALLLSGVALAGLGIVSGVANLNTSFTDGGVSIVAFNPQPEPPTKSSAVSKVQPQSPAVRVGFDPQPEPPTKIGAIGH